MQRAIDGLSVQPTHLLIDAMTLDNALPQVSLIKGDARSVSIAAASIMAKVFRDDYMTQLSKIILNTVLKKRGLWYQTTFTSNR